MAGTAQVPWRRAVQRPSGGGDGDGDDNDDDDDDDGKGETEGKEERTPILIHPNSRSPTPAARILIGKDPRPGPGESGTSDPTETGRPANLTLLLERPGLSLRSPGAA